MNHLATLKTELETQWFEAFRLRSLIVNAMAVVSELDFPSHKDAYQVSAVTLTDLLEITVERLDTHISKLETLKNTAGAEVAA